MNTYGANGIPAFAVFVLPSAFIGTVICCYQCRLSVSCSNSVLAVLKGRRETAPHYYKIYLERFAVCCIGCFLLGIADAVITFFVPSDIRYMKHLKFSFHGCIMLTVKIAFGMKEG